MCALLHWFCSLYLPFPRDPLADIGWAMEECSSSLLTRAQEAHHLDIHQRHLVEVQHCPGSVALHVCLQGLQMLCLQVADQPERRVVLVSLQFNLECHLVSFLSSALSVTVDERSYCKNETRHKLLMYLHFNGKERAELSAIAEGSAHMIGTTMRGAGLAVGRTAPTRWEQEH